MALEILHLGFDLMGTNNKKIQLKFQLFVAFQRALLPAQKYHVNVFADVLLEASLFLQ